MPAHLCLQDNVYLDSNGTRVRGSNKDNTVQPIADMVAKNLEIVSENFQFSTRRTRILIAFISCTMLLPGTNFQSHGQNSGWLKRFQK